jgi:hypothetical protein
VCKANNDEWVILAQGQLAIKLFQTVILDR